MRKGRVVREFTDADGNTCAIIDWGRYKEVALVVLNIDTKTGDEIQAKRIKNPCLIRDAKVEEGK